MDVEQPGNLPHWLSLSNQTASEGHLLGAERGRPAESDAPVTCRRASCRRSIQDEGPLELGDAGEYGQHHSTSGACRVGPGLGKATKAGTRFPEPFCEVEQVAGRSGETVKTSYDKHILLPDLVDQPRQLRAVPPGARRLLLE